MSLLIVWLCSLILSTVACCQVDHVPINSHVSVNLLKVGILCICKCIQIQNIIYVHAECHDGESQCPTVELPGRNYMPLDHWTIIGCFHQVGDGSVNPLTPINHSKFTWNFLVRLFSFVLSFLITFCNPLLRGNYS